MGCENCGASHISYASPTEYDEAIEVKCVECGHHWYEPNDKYIDARKDDMEERYYDRFEQ